MSGNRNVIQNAAYVTAKGSTYLAVSSGAGFQLMSANGDAVAYFFSLASVFPSADSGNIHISSVSASAGYIYAGCSAGDLFVLQLPSSSAGELDLAHRLPAHRDASIWSTAASPKYILSGDEHGSIHAYGVTEAFESLWSLPLPPGPLSSDPVTCLAVRDETVVAGFTSGHIRVYRANLGELAVEISAHVRPITGLSLHPRECLFCTCSEDQYLSTWALPDFASRATSSVENLASQKLENKMLVGVAHLPNDRLAVSAYDEQEILIFRKE